jgi:hypothetical protein
MLFLCVRLKFKMVKQEGRIIIIIIFFFKKKKEAKIQYIKVRSTLFFTMRI